MPGSDSSNRPPKALFQSFSWHVNGGHDPAEDLAELAHDVGKGIAVILDLIEDSILSEDNEDSPILDHVHRAALNRMALASARMLTETAGRVIDRNNNEELRRQKKGKTQ
ncbi:hypothetical protein [Noviherbaspirillum galbum]|uniref:Uncharacterized protein n=1 Tax=Noviherbaspirillum galbum TaxID=2709383 RepID=A0A6B3SVS3_9BURK|nr:hypothetical protein [Noviherbaspirillum galbum]NEX61729.1 hypothetical protein [Noviherbaspirillum galbum]